MRLYAVFKYDEHNMYLPSEAVSRPYKRKAAAEQLCEKMNVESVTAWLVHRGFVVRELRQIKSSNGHSLKGET